MEEFDDYLDEMQSTTLPSQAIIDNDLLDEMQFSGQGGGLEGLYPQPKEIPLRGYEARFAAWSGKGHGRLYAATAVGLQFFPYTKYALPSNQDALAQLTPWEQTTALLLDALGAALMVGGGQGLTWITKNTVGKAYGAATGRMFPKPKLFSPVEDAMRPYLFNPEQAVATQVRRTLGKHSALTDDELNAISAYARGDKEALTNHLFFESNTAQEVSKDWWKVVSWDMRQGAQLKPELTDLLSTSSLQQTFRIKKFNSVVAQYVLGQGAKTKEVPEAWLESIFTHEAERYLGAGNIPAAGWSLRDAPAEVFASFMVDLIKHPHAIRNALRPGRGISFPVAFTNQETVYGTSEAVFGTRSHILTPFKKAIGNTNSHTYSYILTWHTMLQQRGIWKNFHISKTRGFRIKPADGVNAEHFRNAGRILGDLDDITEQIRWLKPDDLRRKELYENLKSIYTELENDSVVSGIVDTWFDLTDTLFAERTIWKVNQLFAKSKLSTLGQAAVPSITQTFEKAVLETFSTSNSLSYVQKVTRLKKQLQNIRMNLHPSWFAGEADEINLALKELNQELKLSRGTPGGKLMDYRENYFTRYAHMVDGVERNLFRALSPKGGESFYAKARKAPMMTGERASFEDIFFTRVRAQSKELYLYSELEKIVQYTSKLPSAWRGHTEHLIARGLNRPTAADEALAAFFEKTVGAVARLGKSAGLWDEQRVRRLGATINNLTYMAGLGLRQFSVLQNLTQPMLTVAADLGGTKDIYTFIRGFGRALRPSTRSYLREIGGITEFAPEIDKVLRVTPFAEKPGLMGKLFDIKSQDSLRDVMLWEFQASDRWSRYWTGGSAMHKWETALRKVGGDVDRRNLSSFMAKAGLQKRNPWVKVELEDLLRRGKLEDAKALFVKDVIGDTQFLYSGLDSPLILTQFGTVSKTAGIFQSWWMNYGTLMEKWLRTGASPGAKIERMFTWMLCSAITHELAEGLWGEEQADRMTFLGPMFHPRGVSLPPFWEIIANGMELTMQSAELLSKGDTDEVKRAALALATSSTMLLPGGVALSSALKAYEKGRWPMVLKSVAGSFDKKKTPYRPPWAKIIDI